MRSIRRATCPVCKFDTETTEGRTDKSGMSTKLKCPVDGSFLKLSTQWYAVGSLDGKKIKQPCGLLKKDADAYIATLLLAVRSGTAIPGREKDISWSDAKKNCGEWWDKEVGRGKMRQSTRDFYKWQILVLDKYFQHESLLSITKNSVESMIDEMGTTHSPAAITHAVKALKRMYAMHTENLDLEDEPRPKLIEKTFIIGKVKTPRVDNTVTVSCTPVDVTTVLAAIEAGRAGDRDKKRLKLAILFGIGMLLRPGNICGLKWADIDMNNAVLTIDKGRMKGRRDIQMPIPVQIIEAIREWRKEVGFVSMYMFPAPGDNNVPMKNMQRALTNWIKKTGLNSEGVTRSEKITPYVLTKHFGATSLMAESDENLELVAKVANHADSKVTRRYIQHGMDHIKQTAIPMQEAVLKQVANGGEMG